jgi:hypothetical protein
MMCQEENSRCCFLVFLCHTVQTQILIHVHDADADSDAGAVYGTSVGIRAARGMG